mmetsp:Transcript_1032/g.2915  ORF Transcript_1032/g.2915 Transcript_1032/m.2915 type:complete len:99 (+) Transcript_1032:224-520(+)
MLPVFWTCTGVPEHPLGGSCPVTMSSGTSLAQNSLEMRAEGFALHALGCGSGLFPLGPLRWSAGVECFPEAEVKTCVVAFQLMRRTAFLTSCEGRLHS